MRFSVPLLFLAATVAFAAEDEPTQTKPYDIDELMDNMSSLLDMLPPVPTNYKPPTNLADPSILNKMPTPPQSLVGAILTAVPGDVVADLMNPLARDSLASAFQAGDMPDWYNSLPTGVKSYFSEVAAQMTASNVAFQPTGAIATGAPEGSLRTTSSEALGSRPTGAVAGSFLVAAGVLGAAIAL
ncbi:hypothetical protein FQN54_005419 [Arachnomyces sp. PD_36]|nr:hypothetical protein FQN54_005419 [Arachnomyces sp. PD_36]